MIEIKHINIAEQKINNGLPFPYVLDGSKIKNDKVAFFSWISQNKDILKSLLHSHDAVLFRNFPIQNAEDFEKMLEVAEFPVRDYLGGAAPREKVTNNRIMTANESPPTETIPFHHEMSQVANPPKYIFFCCNIAAESGGATPIVQSHVVYNNFIKEFPEEALNIEQQGIRYIRVMPEETDVKSAIGRSWKETFQCNTREEAEQKMQSMNMEWEWLEGNNLKTITAALPAVRIDEFSQRKTFFNSMVAAYTGWNDSRNKGEESVITADGKSIDQNMISGVSKLMNEAAVAFKWGEGDVIWINNSTVLHSRETFIGTRKIYASIS